MEWFKVQLVGMDLACNPCYLDDNQGGLHTRSIYHRQPSPAIITNSTPTSLVQVRTRLTLDDSLVDKQISTVIMMMIATAIGSRLTVPAGKRKKLESCKEEFEVSFTTCSLAGHDY